MKHADRVAAAAHAGEDRIRQAPLALQNLPPRFFSDDAVKIADHHGVRMRAQRRAEQVVCGMNVGHPIAHGLADGVF